MKTAVVEPKNKIKPNIIKSKKRKKIPIDVCILSEKKIAQHGFFNRVISYASYYTEIFNKDFAFYFPTLLVLVKLLLLYVRGDIIRNSYFYATHHSSFQRRNDFNRCG